MAELTELLATDSFGGGGQTDELGDDGSGRYWMVTHDRIRLAIRVSLATGRPLLVRGVPGTGKSTFARAVAATLNWRYLAMTVTSRTEASDLLWSIDHLARLRDAQLGGDHAAQVDDISHYIRPGPVWWAFNPTTAASLPSSPSDPAIEPAGKPAVILIDEIDKADPEMPDNLLEVLGWLEFANPADGTKVRAVSADLTPLVVITSNNERDLSPAFLRRCVKIEFGLPMHDQLKEIARGHLPPDVGDQTASTDAIAAAAAVMTGPGITAAAFVDACRAARALGLSADSDELATVRGLLLDEPEPDASGR